MSIARHTPPLVTRSPLATFTVSPSRVVTDSPSYVRRPSLMKVCVEPVSTNETNVVPLMRTCSFMVLAMSMPVSACSDMPSLSAVVSG
jgi:hypothetical protein